MVNKKLQNLWRILSSTITLRVSLVSETTPWNLHRQLYTFISSLYEKEQIRPEATVNTALHVHDCWGSLTTSSSSDVHARGCHICTPVKYDGSLLQNTYFPSAETTPIAVPMYSSLSPYTSTLRASLTTSTLSSTSPSIGEKLSRWTKGQLGFSVRPFVGSSASRRTGSMRPVRRMSPWFASSVPSLKEEEKVQSWLVALAYLCATVGQAASFKHGCSTAHRNECQLP